MSEVMVKNILLTLSIVGNVILFMALIRPQTVEVYTNQDIYYLKGNKVYSEGKGLLYSGAGAVDSLAEYTAKDCSPGAVFSTLNYYAGEGYLYITQYADGYVELNYAGPNWGVAPNQKIRLNLEGFTDVYKGTAKTFHYMPTEDNY